MTSQANENKENNKKRKQIDASYADTVGTQNKLSKIGQDRANNAITSEPSMNKTPNTRTGFGKVTKDNLEHKAKGEELNNSAYPENEYLPLDIHRKGHTQLPKTSKNPNQKNISEQYNKQIPGKYIVKGTSDVTDREFEGAKRRAGLFIGRVNRSATEETLLCHLKSTFPDAEFIKTEIKQHENNTNPNKVFRVGFKLELLTELLKPEVWPRNVIVKIYQFFDLKATKTSSLWNKTSKVQLTVMIL
ncbi:hypothetical protein HHI36_002199 [Cryptolaemus montrouzieri]|uniref:Uncharacterized protein n=1 Tax=Cryptolaemus montrouzieri TaxID=559131 RepID=A0ABD2PB64_9CUCU